MFLVDAAEAGLEEVDERELQEAQLQSIDPHGAMISSGALQFRYIAIEGPIGAGKTALAERLGTRLDATVVLEESENPFLADFYADRPGAALQAQLFYLLNRHRQQTSLRQADLFSQTTICDYVFDKDKIFAYLNLDDNELFIYQRLYELLARDVPPPDLVVYLQAPTDVLLRRVHSRRMDAEAVALSARRRLPARAERGVPPLLLPLQRDAAAGRRNVAVRFRRERRGARRSHQADPQRWDRARSTTCRGRSRRSGSGLGIRHLGPRPDRRSQSPAP